jgi:hypothetical protein
MDRSEGHRASAGDSVIAVVSGNADRRSIIERAMDRAREHGVTLILFEKDASASPLEDPLPTNWSGQGEEQMFGHRLGPQDLEAAGRAELGRDVMRARAGGVDTYAWLPEQPDGGTLADYARDQRATLVIVGPDDKELAGRLDVPTEIVDGVESARS